MESKVLHTVLRYLYEFSIQWIKISIVNNLPAKHHSVHGTQKFQLVSTTLVTLQGLVHVLPAGHIMSATEEVAPCCSEDNLFSITTSDVLACFPQLSVKTGN